MQEPTKNNTGIPPLFEQLKERLDSSLQNYGEVHNEDVLDEQAEILDRTFRHLLERGTYYQPDTQRISAALRAQNQFRYTIKTREAMAAKLAQERRLMKT